MAVGVTVLGSGSKGNATLIHTENSGVLIDNGFSRKELLKRLADNGISQEVIKAIVITHEHGDHVKGVRVLADHLDIPTYCTTDTLRYLKAKNNIGKKQVLFDPGSSFTIEEFVIEPFSVPHDAVQPVAFVIKTGDIKVGVATDLGQVGKLALQRLYDCDLLCLESNYDIDMLKKADRPISLKRRIMGRHGHLDNADALESLEFLLTAKTKHLIMAHVSSDCNEYELVESLTSQKLAEINRSDINMQVARQHSSLEPIWID